MKKRKKKLYGIKKKAYLKNIWYSIVFDMKTTQLVKVSQKKWKKMKKKNEKNGNLEK